MKLINALIIGLFAQAISFLADAGEIKTVDIGDAEIVYDYRTNDTGVAILTLIALFSETNNSIRGLKNKDQRRLSKLGQLIYQCKLMLHKPDKSARPVDVKDPVLISKNYILFTGVDLSLASDERVGIRVQALQTVDDESLFSSAPGDKDPHTGIWETVDEGAAINLKQFNINVLRQTNLIETSESIDIVVRFPVFQLEQPANQWSYNFYLKDFKQAVRHIDKNCTPARFVELINRVGTE